MTTAAASLAGKIDRLVKFSNAYQCNRNHKVVDAPPRCFACSIQSEIESLNSRLGIYFDKLRLDMNNDPHAITSSVAVGKELTGARVRMVIAQFLDKLPDQINTTDNMSSLLVDSLDLVEIVMELEEEFEIEIHDEDVDSFANVESIINYMHERI